MFLAMFVAALAWPWQRARVAVDLAFSFSSWAVVNAIVGPGLAGIFEHVEALLDFFYGAFESDVPRAVVAFLAKQVDVPASAYDLVDDERDV